MGKRMKVLLAGVAVAALVMSLTPAGAVTIGCDGGSDCYMTDSAGDTGDFQDADDPADPALDAADDALAPVYDAAEPVEDAADDVICENPTAEALLCESDVNATDLLSFKLEADSFGQCSGTSCPWTDPDNADYDPQAVEVGQTHGGPALKATWVVDGLLPDEDSLDPPDGNATGWSYHGYYRDTHLLDNRPHPVCERTTSDPDGDGQDLTYLYSGILGHWQDQWMLRIGMKFEYTGPRPDGGAYKVSPEMGYYDPSGDGGFVSFDVVSEEASHEANSMNGTGDYFYRIQRNQPESGQTTLTVKVVGSIPITDTNCKSNPTDPGSFPAGGYQPFAVPKSSGGGATGDLISIAGATWLNTIVRSPVAVPLSMLPPPANEDDIDWLIGLVSLQDIVPNNAYRSGYTAPNLGPGSAPGPSCWTPTFGGTLPPNPNHGYGEPCQIPSPFGDFWPNTGREIFFP
ncbi:MAG TPA: hypothetical protein VGB83_06760 [Actinomycetota bacterium]